MRLYVPNFVEKNVNPNSPARIQTGMCAEARCAEPLWRHSCVFFSAPYELHRSFKRGKCVLARSSVAMNFSRTCTWHVRRLSSNRRLTVVGSLPRSERRGGNFRARDEQTEKITTRLTRCTWMIACFRAFTFDLPFPRRDERTLNGETSRILTQSFCGFLRVTLADCSVRWHRERPERGRASLAKRSLLKQRLLFVHLRVRGVSHDVTRCRAYCSFLRFRVANSLSGSRHLKML